MATLILPLDAGRALVQIEVDLSETARLTLKAGGFPLPVPVIVTAIIDTGAEITCIDPCIRQALGLDATDSIEITTAFGPVEGQACDLFEVALLLRHPDGNPASNLQRSFWSVAETPVAHTGAEVLIGTDLLVGSRFLYDGIASSFTWHY